MSEVPARALVLDSARKLVTGQRQADSYVDLCGYGALAAELAGVSIDAGDKGGAV
jgi:hypothetical protein